MNTYRIFACTAILLLLFAGCSQETPTPKPPPAEPAPKPAPAKLGSWNDHYDSAANLAMEKRLPLFLYFCGSDWCPHCMRMDADVLNTREWLDYAGKAFVLVKIDFPRKRRLPENHARRNNELRELWEVNSFPTFLVLDPEAKGSMAKLKAFPDESAAAFIDRVKKALKAQPVNDDPVALQGVELYAATGKGEDVEYLLEGVKPGHWTHDMAAATAEARKTKKPILFMFTGSDWSPSCIILKKKVLSRANWQRFARKNLILFVVDFPQKNKLPNDIRQRNDRLAKEYKVQGYPTLILVQPDGKTTIGSVDLAYSPHALRKNICKHLRLSTGNVDTVASGLPEDEAAAYREAANELLTVRQEEQVLVEKADALQRSGGLTAAFSAKVKRMRERVLTLDVKVKGFEVKAKANAFKGEKAQRYMKLQNELIQAGLALDKWLAALPEQTPETLEELRDKRKAIQIVREAIEDMDVARIGANLSPERKATYQRIFNELRTKRRRYRSWLDSDPEITPETKKRDQRYNEEINLLEDRLDAIRDG